MRLGFACIASLPGRYRLGIWPAFRAMSAARVDVHSNATHDGSIGARPNIGTEVRDIPGSRPRLAVCIPLQTGISVILQYYSSVVRIA